MLEIEATKIENGITVNPAKKVKISKWDEFVKNAKELGLKVDSTKVDVPTEWNAEAKPEWELVNIDANEITAYAAPKPIRIVGRGVAQAKDSWDSFRQQNIYSGMADNNEHDNIYKELKNFGYSKDFAQAAEQTIDNPELTEEYDVPSTYTQDLSAIIREATDKIGDVEDFEFEENPSTYTQDLSAIIREATERISSSSEEDEFENQQTIEDLVRKALNQPEKKEEVEKENPSTYTQDLSAIIREATSRMSSEDFEPVEKEETMSFHNLEINDLLKYITKITEANDELEHSIETIEERNKKMLNTYYGITDETRKYEAEALEKANKLKQMRESQQERLRMREEEVINEGRSIKSDWMAADERNLRAKQLNEQISAMMLDSSDYSQEEEVAYKKVA